MKIMTNLLGLSASFYLGFNLIIGGGLTEIPIVLLSFVSIVFFRSSEASLHHSFKSRILWSFVLLGFSLFSCFMVWFYEGAIELYEPYAKLLVASLAALALAYHRVKLVYIRAGLYLAAISLIYLYFFEYTGLGRFSNGMNPNKWSPLLLGYAVASIILIFIEKSYVYKLLAFFSYFVFLLLIIDHNMFYMV